MHRVYDLDIRAAREMYQGGADPVESLAEAFAAVRRNHDQLPERIGPESVEAGQPSGLERPLHVEHCVDARIPGNVDRRPADSLALKVPRGPLGCRKVEGGQSSGQQAVALLRERSVEIAGSETGLDVPHRNLGIEGRQGSTKGGRRIALNQNDAGLFPNQNRLEGCNHARGGLVKRLPGLHDVQVQIGMDIEDI